MAYANGNFLTVDSLWLAWIDSKWGTDEKGLFKLLCASPAEYLEKLNLVYADKYGYTLLKTMEKELGKSFSLQDHLLLIE